MLFAFVTSGTEYKAHTQKADIFIIYVKVASGRNGFFDIHLYDYGFVERR